MSLTSQKGAGRPWPYGLCYFAVFAVYGIVSPYLQLLLQGLGYSPSLVGLFLSLFETVGIIAPLVISNSQKLSSRGRLVLFGTSLAVLLSLPGFALIRSPAATALSVALLAIGVKTMVPFMDAESVSYLKSRAESGAKGRVSYGSLRVMGSIGFIFASFLFGRLSAEDQGKPEAISLAIGITVVFLVLCLFSLPAHAGSRGGAAQPVRTATPPAQTAVPPVQTATPAPQEAEQVRARRGAARNFDPLFFLGLIIIALNRLAIVPATSFISLYVRDELRANDVGWLWSLSAASEIPLMIFSSVIIGAIGPMASVAIASGAVALRLAICAFFPSVAGVAAGQLLHSLCFGLFYPAAVAFVAERVPEEKRPLGMALFSGLAVGLPTVLGNALGGFVAEHLGYRTLFLSFIGFAIASVLLYLFTAHKFTKRTI